MYLLTVDDFAAMYGSGEWGMRAFQMFKADDPLLTTTTGVYAPHYGSKIWAQVNLEMNPFGVIPKVPWGPEDGWTVATAFPTNLVEAPAENGAIPDTDKPDFVKLYDKPRNEVTPFNASEIEILSARRGQAVKWQDLVEFEGQIHKLGLSDRLCRDNGTAVGNHIYGIDHICSSNSEIASCTQYDGNAYTADDADVYGLNRDAGVAAWHDANVLHASAVLRPFSLSLVNDLERTVAQRCGVWDSNEQFWLTGPDTYQVWYEKLQSQQRFMEATFEVAAFNGIKTVSGTHGGFRLATYHGKPIIVSHQLEDYCKPTGGITNVYLLNTKYLKLWVDVPTIYQEVGVAQGNELLYGKLGEEGMYRTVGQLICNGFFAQGKLRDLSE